MDERELLKSYVETGNQEAFAEVVNNHGSWLVSAARRQLGDEHLAEDVTQAVFVLLLKRAGRLRRYNYVGGWLFLALSYCVKRAKRERARLARREKEAASMRKEAMEEAKWEDVAPELDAAVGKLGKVDRDAILLRFYERRPLAEVGKALGISEEAARMRVQRAVGSLREKLGKKGITGTTAGLSAVLVGNVVGQMPEGLAEKIVSAVGSGGGNTVAAAIAKGAEKMMVWAKVKVVAVIAALVVVAGTVTAVVAQQAKPSPTSQPNVTSAALKPVIQGDVIHVRTNGTDGPGVIGDTWFVRGKGIVAAQRYSSGTVSCQLDDGVNTWRYRVGGKIIGRSASEKTVDTELKRIEDRLVKAAPSGLVRDASGDRVVAGVNNRCYKPVEANKEAQISAIWVDEAQRLRAVSMSVAHERDVEISYEDPVPEALFSTAWPQDAQIIGGDGYLAERYPLAKALFKKEAAGLVFAVHECAMDDRGCYYILCSTRPASGTDKDLGMIKGYVGGVEARRMTVGRDDRESLGYIPEELGHLQNVYGWVQTQWYAFVPDPSVPELHGVLRFAAKAFAANELQTWRKGRGLPVTEEFVVELDGNLDGKTGAPTSAEDFARTFWTEGERLWPAVDGTLWMTKPSRNGNGILEAHRPGAVPQEEYLKNVRQRIDQVMNPQEPSPWQMR